MSNVIPITPPEPEFDSDEYWLGDDSLPEVTMEAYNRIFDEPDAPDYGRLEGINIRFPGASSWCAL